MKPSMPGYFFTPKHIILVGASETAGSLGERILTALLSSSFQGKVTPVNLHHKSIAGLTAYSSLAKIPDSADLVIAATAPESYETLFKACRKQQLHHIILIQDWDNLPPEAWRTAANIIKKYHDHELSISVCNPSGFQLPTQGLNGGTLPDFPAGHVALLSGDDSLSRSVSNMLRRMNQGLSRHISLNFELSPVSAADWINRFGHNRHTRVAVLHFNPSENARKLFSAVRHFTRHTPVILCFTHEVDENERAVLFCLARHGNFLPVFGLDELESALHAYLADLKPIDKLTVLADMPVGWLNNRAQKLGLSLHLPSEKTSVKQGNIGSYPSPAGYRSIVAEQLQHPDTEALLAVISNDDETAGRTFSRMLNNLARSSDKPLLISSHFSDGLLHMRHPKQALHAIALRNTGIHLKNLQNRLAEPAICRLKTPDTKAVAEALANQNTDRLPTLLHLPKAGAEDAFAVKISAEIHPRYGLAVYIRHQGQTGAVLPPFSTLDSHYLAEFADIEHALPHIAQFLHSVQILFAALPDFGRVSLLVNGRCISSQIQPADKPTEAEPAYRRLIAANPAIAANKSLQAAGQFIRQTGEAAAELLHYKILETQQPVENVRAPYPDNHPKRLTLRNGQNVRIRAFTPEDVQAKQDFVRRLSPQSRYSRFMAVTNQLPDATLARFSKLDYQSEGAYIAENSDGLIVGVSRFSRLSRDECEFGITLAEDMRGSGLATEMMQLIIRLATQQGYRSMSAEILKSNTAMLKLAEKSGFSLIESAQDKAVYQAKRKLLPQSEPRKFNLKQ